MGFWIFMLIMNMLLPATMLAFASISAMAVYVTVIEPKYRKK